MKINTLKEMIGAVVPEVTGEIVKLWPAKNGVTNGKSWSLQGGTIKDETGEIDFTIWNRTELPQSLRGVTMTIKSGLGVKGGLRGLKVDKNKKDPSKLVLQVEDKATIMDKENSIQEDAKDDIPMEYGHGGLGGATTAQEAVSVRKAVRGFDKNENEVVVENFINGVRSSKTPQERIAQFGKLYDLCLLEASRVPNIKEVDVKDVASCFFISATKEGLVDKMKIEIDEAF